jgi:flagellar assembly factor FliW
VVAAASAGTLEIAEAIEVPVIEFVAPMPGFPQERRFMLVRLDDAGLLFALTAVDDENLRFLVMPPGAFFPDYAPEIDDESLAALGVSDVVGLLVLLVVTAGASPPESTVNLMAPIIMYEPTRRAVQLVLNGSGLQVRAPLITG